MTTHDTPEAALAAALHVWLGDGDGYLILHSFADAQAAGILAALDGWTLVPDDVWEAMSDRAAERARYEAEITQLVGEITQQVITPNRFIDHFRLRTEVETLRGKAAQCCSSCEDYEGHRGDSDF